MKTVKLKVEGMMCAHCAKTVESTLLNLGVSASVDLGANKVFIKYDETKVSLERLKRALSKAGYNLVLQNEKSSLFPLVSLIIGIVLTIPFIFVMLHMMGIHNDVFNFFANSIVQLVLATIIQIIVGFGFYKRAFYQIKTKNPGMDVLVSLATSSAYVLSIYSFVNGGMLYFESSAMVLTIISIGQYISDQVKKKTGKALDDLSKLQAKDAVKLINGKEKLVPIEQVDVDDIILVKIGERIPLDGIIISGSSSVDESTITGESKSVHKEIGNNVFGSTINVSSSLTIKVTHDIDSSLIGQIVEKVNLSSINKPRIQKLSDKIANIFVPAVILISIITFLVNYFAFSIPLEDSIIRGVATLVVSCPCALGLAVPMSVVIGYSLAAKKGVLFNSGEIFETMSKIDTICFDKTGTLTYGKLKIVDVFGNKDFLPLVKSMETHSTHPIAKSLVEEIEEKEIKETLLVENVDGLGLKTVYDGLTYFLGSNKLVEKNKISLTKDQASFILANADSTLAILTNQVEVLLIVALEDKIKDSSLSVINNLNKLNVETYMISGDKKEVALKMAKKLNIKEENVFSEVNPLEKEDKIKALQKLNKRVAFVGDGVNDALALQASDLGIAVRSGADIALYSADVTILETDMNAVIKSIQISRMIRTNIIENFGWALTYNLVMMPLAMSGMISPIVSGIAMASSNILVVLNALRMYLKKK